MTAELHHRRILVVDDDAEVRELLSTTLRQRALTVDAAGDGDEAVELLRENRYSVVLLDLIMPELDGFGVLDALAADAITPPVVLVVTGADRSMVERLDSRRIHGVVRKPFDPHELADVVAACADIRGRSAFETMALTTMISGAPLIAWWASTKL
ncbi:MAG TPA: response regulator [Thermoanaerobaculia bacterium]|jgi:two-component system OmpR family response regulator